MRIDLKPKFLSEFLQLSATQLLSDPRDGIHVTSEITYGGNVLFNDIGDQAYLLGLSQPRLVPSEHFKRVEKQGTVQIPQIRGRGNKAPVKQFRHANLMYTQSNEIISDSLHRYKFASIGVGYDENNQWYTTKPNEFNYLDGTYLYLDLACGHFGHAILENGARVWPLSLGIKNIDLSCLKMVAYGVHIDMHNTTSWPTWLTSLMASLGINPESLHIIREPTVVQRLIVPRRISPYMGNSGRQFSATMQKAAMKLIGSRHQMGLMLNKRIFLSRSELSKSSARNSQRALPRETELLIERLFESRGFAIVHPQEYSLEDQVRIVNGADFIAGCVGSQMHLLAFNSNPRLKAMRIAPSFFAPPHDHYLLKGACKEFADFVVNSQIVSGYTRGNSPWNLSDECLVKLTSKVDEMIA
jgi:hypothetical protein